MSLQYFYGHLLTIPHMLCQIHIAQTSPTQPVSQTIISHNLPDDLQVFYHVASSAFTRARPGCPRVFNPDTYLDAHPHCFIGLEQLTDIHERTRRTHGKKASKKQRKANAAFSRWSFAELQSMIAYKALWQGSMAIKVDAHYTSKACPRCGHTCDANRPHKGLLFICQNCHYTLHADLVGARNIVMRALLVRQDWMSTGSLSLTPDVSSIEIKAARLQRYAELRWSLDTSPVSLDQRI